MDQSILRQLSLIKDPYTNNKKLFNHHHLFEYLHSFKSLLSNSSSINSTTITNSSCPDWILQMPQVPLSDDNQWSFTEECPDIVSVPIISGLFLAIYFLLIVLCSIGLYWKRNNGHIKARTLTGMIFTMFSSFLFVFGFGLRFVVGREYFPCFFFSMVFIVLPPCLTLPSTLRTLRMFIKYKVNMFKKKHFEQNQNVLERRGLSPHVMTSKVFNVVNPSSSDHQKQTQPTPISRFQKTSPENRVSIIETPGNDNIQEFLNVHKLERSEKVLFKLNSLISSNRFSVDVFIGFLLMHLALWIVLAAIEDTFFSNSRFLMKEISMISLKGCYANMTPSIISFALYVFYLGMEFICVVLSFKTEDTWFIKKEAIILVIFQVLFVITHVIISTNSYMSLYIDHIIPQGLIMMTFSALEVFMTILLPICYSIAKDYRGHLEVYNSEVEFCLHHKEAFEILTDFSRKSYCIEGILFFKDVETFKVNRKREMALHIVQSYLNEGSTYELNVANIATHREEILYKINTSSDVLPQNLFSQLEFLSMHTLLDVYDRLKRSNPRISELAKEWRQQIQQNNISTTGVAIVVGNESGSVI